MLGIVDRNAGRLLGLVNDLLFAAQVAARDQVSLVLESVDLADVVTEAVAAAAPRAERGGVSLAVDVQSAPLRGDAMRISQVADNLISNAIKFTPPGGTVRVVLDSKDHDVFLTVSDSGIGIAGDEQADLFAPFYRTKAAKASAIQGTGLGLSIVKSMVGAPAARSRSRVRQGPARRSSSPYRACRSRSRSALRDRHLLERPARLAFSLGHKSRRCAGVPIVREVTK